MKSAAPFIRLGGVALGVLAASLLPPNALRAEPARSSAPVAAAPAVAGPGTPPPLPVFLALDFALPGYGAFYEDAYLAGFSLALLRLGTAALALEFQRQRSVYESAERAARFADLYYGGPLRYRDPYGDGYHSAEEFARLADRRTAYARLGVSAHLLTTVISLARTYFLHEKLRAVGAPALDLSVDADGASGDLRFDAQLRFSAEAF